VDEVSVADVLERRAVADGARESRPAPPQVQLSGVSRWYTEQGGAGIEGISLTVQPGEILSVLGPSGSGKSTLLKCIAGLERPDAGDVVIAGRTVSSADRRIWVPPERRGVGVVFQSLALWSHMTVYENVGFPLRTAKVKAHEIRQRVTQILELVGCERYMSKRPSELSGGEQQRVACARALVARPALVLFDEPFSSLDAALRESLRRWLLELRDETQMTAIFVTHDQAEAFTVGDKIAVVHDARLAGFNTARSLYYEPPTEKVARIVGPVNSFEGRLVEMRPPYALVETDCGQILARVRSPDCLGGRLRIGFRPRSARIMDRSASADEMHLTGTIQFSRFTGTVSRYEVQCGSELVNVLSMDDHFAVGDEVRVAVRPDEVWVHPVDHT
jgi:iron(III) transport system ATP-binding protein